ncbi:sigma-54 dependent transcriptional regulator [Opitutales bacterium ASA1]|uniref:sigma-54-dependent transcriptional regulator n=1 Tax=Congregicoccus parvus TaxID=3081749 RepID=UPI002B303A84|nr:sigma-54 dependent transcriptional regulator [Opitutales bacterium ASA1]
MSQERVRLKNAAILVLDDEVLLRRRIAAWLERAGAEVVQAGNLAEARKAAAAMPFDFALVDVNLPDGRGTELLGGKLLGAGTSVIVMTAEGGVAGAVEAMRLGAVDYLTKPFDIEELPFRFERARRSKQQTRVEEHRRTHDSGGGDQFFFGRSLAAMEQQLELILAADRRIVKHPPPVLIEGETGTGKTTIARWIHRRGPRADGPLVEVNCSALPETLAESELFGHEKGAFTDAKSARIGLLEAADGGTLFLDELPSLPLPLQAKLLTALEDHAIRRVGGSRMQEIDTRIVAATNADLRRLVTEGRFREDLFHRLDLFRVRIPPLRERGEDIVALARLLLARIGKRYALSVGEIPETGRKRLLAHQWPGNVRELAHELERAVVFDGGDLRFDALARRLYGTPVGDADSSRTPPWLRDGYTFPEEGFSIEGAVDELVRRALEQTGGNASAAARLLGTTRDFVRYRLRDRSSGR